jgi:hypothetical protein
MAGEITALLFAVLPVKLTPAELLAISSRMSEVGCGVALLSPMTNDGQ